MLPLLLAALATATPPPRRAPDAPPRLDGFHAVYVAPDAFANSLQPAGPPPADPRPVVVVVLDPGALAEAELSAEAVAEQLRAVPGVAAVAPAVEVTLETPRDLATTPIEGAGGTVPLGSLGSAGAPPPSGPRLRHTPIPVPRPGPPPGHDLVVVNAFSTRAVLVVMGTAVGELDPHATGTVRDVWPGAYDIALRTADGVVRERRIEVE